MRDITDWKEPPRMVRRLPCRANRQEAVRRSVLVTCILSLYWALLSTAGCSRPTVTPASVKGASSGVRAPAPRETLNTTEQPIRTISWSDSLWRPRVPHRDWKYLVIHHSATDAGSVESFDRIHRQRRDADGNHWRGIGYHFVIGNGQGMRDGAIEPTFRWREQLIGAHAGIANYNQHGIGICLVGNFEQKPPTSAQVESLKRVMTHVTEDYGISAEHVVRHRDIKATVCPGKLFPMREVIQASFPASRRRIFSKVAPR